MSDKRNETSYDVIGGGRVPIKMWTRGVPVEHAAIQQLTNIASLPFIYKHVAVMPDVHLGRGATVGSVVPTKGAIIPAAVGVDIGCGMCAVKTNITANDLPNDLKKIRVGIEEVVPAGEGLYIEGLNNTVKRIWQERFDARYEAIIAKHPKVAPRKGYPWNQIGTLGGGNHFIEVCLDTEGNMWVMLHSGSRGIGNRIGTYFIERAKEEMRRFFINLPDKDLAYLAEGSELFDDYVEALNWAQEYAMENRQEMLRQVLAVLKRHFPALQTVEAAINCHHNYVAIENHYGENVFITRKGAVRAREGDLGIIPSAMKGHSFIVRGKGNKDSFDSCSHGAGRVMSRSKAKQMFTEADVALMTEGVECRKDAGVIDELPSAYKSIEAVMQAQADLVEPVTKLSQIICVKG